jgi:NifB/MoaA-like Fe-S oxidoreductase
LVYPSDEWYLLAGRRVPPATQYDGFGQVENGVGMVRQFLDEWKRVKYQISNVKCQMPNVKWQVANIKYQRAILVCGELAAPVLGEVVDELNELTGSDVHVAPIVNHWYGVVTVSGLLTGRDVVEQLTESAGEMVLLPRVMFGNSAQVTLDDMTPTQIQEALGAPVALAQHPGEMLAALRGELSPQEL